MYHHRRRCSVAFTGDTVYGWRIAKMVDGRRPMHGTGFAAWVDEPVVELVKGHRHIRAKGEQGIDPQIVLARAITAALADDMRELHLLGRSEEFAALARVFTQHERQRKVYENGWAVQRMNETGTGAVFHAGTAGAKGTPSGV
jgi:hypothetical protein